MMRTAPASGLMCVSLAGCGAEGQRNGGEPHPVRTPHEKASRVVVQRFLAAYERGDLAAVCANLTDQAARDFACAGMPRIGARQRFSPVGTPAFLVMSNFGSSLD